MTLIVNVISASNLPNIEKFGKSDPFCVVEFLNEKKETKVIDDELNPVWNEKLEFDLKGKALSGRDKLALSVKDKETIGKNRLLGTANVPLKDLLKGSNTMQVNVNLMDASDKPNTGTVNLQITYNAPSNSSSAAGGEGQTVSASVAESTEGGVEEDEEYEDVGGEAEAGDGGIGPSGKKLRKARRKSRKSLSTKPQDFQIRVKVVEARQLQGGNICPVSRVTCYNQTKQTRVKKSTNSPFWNEVFFFNFFASPAELFDELISFQVYNSRKLRSDALIGSFKCDIGLVYDEANHTLLNKWLLLSDPDDTMAGAKGYLKISVTVMGPGDEAPSFKAVEGGEDEDIEANLLRPAGVQLRPASFILRVYKAEDLPRMDSDLLQGMKKMVGLGDENKELVDPYLIFSFAGKEVRTKIMYSCDHPEFNQELRLGLRFPSMCERIKLQIKDWDRLTEDDPIGTTTIALSQVSAQGDGDKGDEGFLPCFGPCYVNFYGSPREYSDLPDEYEDLNLGKGEGCAYRGRAIVELQTKLGEMPEVDVEDLNNDFVLRAGKFLRRRKYRLHCAFLNATMIQAIDAPVEFEVSIGCYGSKTEAGNYGNKLDVGVPPSSSTTQPTNAVFDGTFYYFLPWGNSKPCTVVESHWEDISFRLEALNMIQKIIDRLQDNIDKVKLGLKANLPTPEQAQLLISALDQLVIDCNVWEDTYPPSKKLPDITPGQSVKNDLDRMVQTLRENELRFIKKEASKLRENATDVQEAMHEMEGYMEQLKNVATEPQNSMPDVVIWMISGDKRIAYFRIPAYDVIYSANPDNCGKNCGKEQTIYLKCIEQAVFEGPTGKKKKKHRSPTPGSKAEKEGKDEIPAMIRCKIWLGQEKEEHAWTAMQSEGELAVFAETYENQVNVLGRWTDMGPTMTRPKWSDAAGKIKLKKEDFEPPPSWRWDTDWFVSPELSMLFDKDAGHRTYMEDAFECQGRIPGGEWGASSVAWTDVKGDSAVNRDEIRCPSGWAWDDDWQVDFNRPCDEEGWEFTVEATLGGYMPVEKTYHMCRRRRWVRSRTLVKDAVQEEQQEEASKEAAEGWEYAPLFNMKFHAKERKMDLVRRRRWHRKMVAEGSGAGCFFNVSIEDPLNIPLRHAKRPLNKKDSDKQTMAAPRMFLTFDKSQKYQLRSYIYQARDILAGDSTGLSDPFARISFLNQSQVTEKVEKTLCPTWDQTLMFEQVEIHGDPRGIADNPPQIVIEIFDHDTFGEDEFLGRTICTPLVKLDPSDGRTPVLQWHEFKKSGKYAGELLAAFELFLVTDKMLQTGQNIQQLMNGKDLPFHPPKRGNLYLVPNGIRPVMQRTGIEVLCWGVRNMRKFQLASVTSPSVELEVGGHMVTSPVIKSTKRNPNFDNPLLFFDVMLPKEELYMPPMNIRVRDHRQFGRKPLVGNHCLKSMEKYRVEPRIQEIVEEPGEGDPNGPMTPAGEHVIDMPDDGAAVDTPAGSQKKKDGKKKSDIEGQPLLDESMSADGHSIRGSKRKKPRTKKSDPPMTEYSLLDEDIDWWSKFYASIGQEKKCKKYLDVGYDKLEVYKSELEKVGNFEDFDDFCSTFDLNRGKNLDEEESNVVGEFKGSFRVYPLPGDPNSPMPGKHFSNLPDSAPVECLVRVYIIDALELQPNDPSGLADPYISLTLGKKKENNRDDYIPNSLDPCFGRLFEMKTTLPLEKDLHIMIKDYDLLSTDDVIGETTIDLENRYLSKYRATVGLQKSYQIDGPNRWRDAQKPKEILDNYCEMNHLAAPQWFGNNGVKVGGRVYNLGDFETNKPMHDHLGPPDERLALFVLHTFPLVKEHVETRPLYSPIQPGIEQGKLHMWIDLFDLNLSMGAPPDPIDVSPRTPKKYVLRMVIWNTVDVILEEESITGEKMSDIYVKGWMSGIEDKQETDVHYRSMDGEGNFNWRFVFPFDYLPAEQVMVIKKKEHFWNLDETELKLPPTLMLQIWDNDLFSADDYLGNLEIDLNSMPSPAKKASQCDLHMLPGMGKSNHKTVSLFDSRRVRGFWPCFNDETGTKELTGKIEMELELVTEEEANEKPAATGREEPNDNPHLEKPNRPSTSFMWFTSPWKTLKHIIWKQYKWYFITALIIIIVGALVVLFVYSIPGAAVDKMFGAF
ncbi:myoferlin-like isoform X1 [Lineus longissimus]|uniref:myoferlin-like isoform X1 n=1 Tax=Lineus longissimus TaxID=88925 RepID=UPI00315CB887